VYCSTCGDEREFEQPPCADGHGPDCPERACTVCGTAVLVGLPLSASPAPPAPSAASPAPELTGPGLTGPDPARPDRAASERAVA
jgi:hypothetical protein